MILPLAVFAQLATSCGPSVHVDTLAAVARTESAFDTDSINDNTDHHQYRPRSREDAIALATNLITVKHHSVDLGLMQINSANLANLGMTITDAFDPCKNIAGAARILSVAYHPPANGENSQPALLHALSRYNTGHPLRGLSNGYVAKVQASAEQVVPAIRLNGPSAIGQEEKEGLTSPQRPPPPPSWDVFGRARYTRQYGSVTQTIAPDVSTTVQLRPVKTEVGANDAASPQ